MDEFHIEGGIRLKGEVPVSGAKNAALPILIAALLVEEGESVIRNVPDLRDIHTCLKVLGHLGVESEFDLESATVRLDASSLNSFEAPYELVQQMRASFLVMGPLLARLGQARISLPGGCAIGSRPVDQHRKAFRAMGTHFEDEGGYMLGTAEPLKGATIFFDRPSHTGTENVIMGAVLARGTTTIVNAACDPEVSDLACSLRAAGANISGEGSTEIVIEGVDRLHPLDHSVMPDRLEAATFLIAGAITGGRVTVRGAKANDLGLVLSKLGEMGVEVTSTEESITAGISCRPESTVITTYPFPGFPTDLQAAIMALTCVAEGASVIRETVFEDRFLHVAEMARLGAEIRTVGDEATVMGVENLSGASVMASDIRAGAGLVLACLAAEGESVITRVYHIDRGHERIEERLRSLGARITREG
ncbi:UDP-N-acetylglucosamine 1-carboxyvinyltransferase [Gemmatimonadota bacterium]